VNRSTERLVARGRAFAIATAMGVVSTSAFAQPMPPPPPPEFVATAEPFYYEGHAAYWYDNHWYYHDAHGAWAYYHDEPRALADRRRAAPPARHTYAAPPRGAPQRSAPARTEPTRAAPSGGGGEHGRR
jgi:hypothetical protein